MTRQTQLPHYGSGSLWDREDITIPRGDSNRFFTFEHEYDASEIALAEFTVRKKVAAEPGSGTPTIQIPSDTKPFQWIIEDKKATLIFVAANTSGFTEADDEMRQDFDIQFTLTSGDVTTITYGDLLVQYDVTYDSGDAAYLSWDTRDDYDDLLTQYTAGFKRTFLSAAASASDTDIDVVSAAALDVGAGDTIHVVLDDNTSDELTVDSVSADNVDFSTSHPGGLSGAAAANNVVIKEP